MTKGKGQRHEVMVLVVALAVLVGAVAMFVVRSQPKSAPPPPPVQAAQPKAPVAPKPDSTPSPAGRDPFSEKQVVQAPPSARPAPGPGPRLAPAPRQARGPEPAPGGQVTMTLVGVTSGSSPVAVIHRGTRKYYVKVGGVVKGYTVARIAADRVVLTKGTERITLLLREPVTDEE